MKHWKCGMLTNFGDYIKKLGTLVDPSHADKLTLPTAVVLLTNEAKHNRMLPLCSVILINFFLILYCSRPPGMSFSYDSSGCYLRF
jgi:hypothetical protein